MMITFYSNKTSKLFVDPPEENGYKAPRTPRNLVVEKVS